MVTCSRRELLGTVALGAAVSFAGCLDRDGEVVEELDAPTIGQSDAPLVRVFSDFACPGCQWFKADVFPGLESHALDGDLRLEHRDMLHLESDWNVRVANGARAVQHHADDEAFFAYASSIFPELHAYSYDRIESTAEQVAGLGDEAREAAESGTYQPVLDGDYDLALDLEVGRTPEVVIGDEVLDVDLGQSPDAIVAEIVEATD